MSIGTNILDTQDFIPQFFFQQFTLIWVIRNALLPQPPTIRLVIIKLLHTPHHQQRLIRPQRGHIATS